LENIFFIEGGNSKFSLSRRLEELNKEFEKSGGIWEKTLIGKYFDVKGNPQLNKESFHFSNTAEYPYFTRTVENNGILGYVDYLDEAHKIPGNSIAVGMLGMRFFYMGHDFYAGQFTKTVFPKFEKFNEKIAQYFIVLFNKNADYFLGGLVRDFENLFKTATILLPMKNGAISFDYIEQYITILEQERLEIVKRYLADNGLTDCELTEKEKDSLASPIGGVNT